jgi:hypothetical protein
LSAASPRAWTETSYEKNDTIKNYSKLRNDKVDPFLEGLTKYGQRLKTLEVLATAQLSNETKSDKEKLTSHKKTKSLSFRNQF